ncbi:ABC transporter permease [Bdellovibrio sp. ArHS]|uniref:ABC transporter permease n=1 Tax=Bdellovibrio sp. ArHS TaxID=1569284 RepID=UPI000B1A7192|nr:ABC transporter permease [Bdellovibrio sp. ArHS]
MKALSRKLQRDISSLRIQIITMAVLLACGTAILVASWSSYVTLKKAQTIYYEQYHFPDVFAELVKAPKSVVESLKNIQGIDHFEDRIILDALIDLPDLQEPAVGRLISFTEYSVLNKIHLKKGRFPEPGTIPEVIVHESFASAHRIQPGGQISLQIKGQKKIFKVSGIGISPEYVYALSPLVPFPDDLHFGILWVDKKELSRLGDMQDSFNNIVASVKKTDDVDSVRLKIDQLLAVYGSTGSYDRSKQISNMFIEDEIRQQRSMSIVVPAIFIIVSTFILYTVLSRLISLHRAQIATLKSLGYTSFSLALYYLKLVSIILFLGIVPALVFAYGIGQWYAYLYARYFHFPSIDFSLSPQAVVIGTLAGFLPGWIASSISLFKVFTLQPAEAMRPPAPAKFSQSVFEKWQLLQFKDIQTKMILRNVLAKPWRTFLSILGVSAAIGILINGSFWTDMVDFMVQRQFRESSHEDMEISFLHPRKEDVIQELARIKGVYLIEGLRTAPVKMTYKNIEKITVINSRENADSLRPMIDKEGMHLQPKENQVILSQYFNKKYGIKVGDTVYFELTDRSKPKFSAVVGGFIEDVVGASVYANKSDLHRWLSEQPNINTVYLKVDPRWNNEVYIKLKEFPEVASIGVRKLLLESFTKNLSDMIQTFTVVLVLFAMTISAAVLFNMARITLSEKSWELASMRIMGFDIPETFRVLYLELGFQVLAALFPGLALGYGLSYLSTVWIHTDTFSFPLVINTETYAKAIVTIVIIYAVTGFFLYKKVRSLSMAEALKVRD